MKPLSEYPKEQREDLTFKEKYRKMLKTVRCVWCGAEFYVGDLGVDEHDKHYYCPVCKHDKFDDRPCKSFVSAMFLQDTWRKDKK